MLAGACPDPRPPGSTGLCAPSARLRTSPPRSWNSESGAGSACSQERWHPGLSQAPGAAALSRAGATRTPQPGPQPPSPRQVVLPQEGGVEVQGSLLWGGGGHLPCPCSQAPPGSSCSWKHRAWARSGAEVASSCPGSGSPGASAGRLPSEGVVLRKPGPLHGPPLLPDPPQAAGLQLFVTNTAAAGVAGPGNLNCFVPRSMKKPSRRPRHWAPALSSSAPCSATALPG